MTEKDLRQLGRNLPIPSPDEKKREKALYLSLLALKNADAQSDPDSVPDSTRFFKAPFFWALAGTLGVILVTLILQTTSLPPSDQKFQVLSEMEKVFGPRLEAVVSRNGDTEIQLSEMENVSNDQRIWITLESKGVSTEIITYSGCNFWIDDGGKRVKIEALAEAGGGVLLVGDSFVWNSKDSPPINGEFHIKARRLQPGNT